MCDHDCLNCLHKDCDSNDSLTDAEMMEAEAMDRNIQHEEYVDAVKKQNKDSKSFRYFQSAKGKEALKKYKASNKGKASGKKYNDSEKGKARLQKYYQSEKGKANERRKAERRKLSRLMQKEGVVA